MILTVTKTILEVFICVILLDVNVIAYILWGKTSTKPKQNYFLWVAAHVHAHLQSISPTLHSSVLSTGTEKCSVLIILKKRWREQLQQCVLFSNCTIFSLSTSSCKCYVRFPLLGNAGSPSCPCSTALCCTPLPAPQGHQPSALPQANTEQASNTQHSFMPLRAVAEHCMPTAQRSAVVAARSHLHTFSNKWPIAWSR